MALLAPPEELQMEGDLEETWPLFKQRFLLYVKAAGAAQWPNDQKVALFLTVAGPAALQVFNTFQIDPKEMDDLDAVLAHFESYCMPRRNEVYERFLFRTRLQQHRESIEDFVADLQHRSYFCNFGAQREALVRDQVILGCRSGKIRQRLLQHEGLTLEHALKICFLAQAKEEAQLIKKLREQRPTEKQTRFQLEDVRQSKGPVLLQKVEDTWQRPVLLQKVEDTWQRPVCQQKVEDTWQRPVCQQKVEYTWQRPVCQQKVEDTWQRPVCQQKVEDTWQSKGPVCQQKVQCVEVMGNTKDNSQQQWDYSQRKESYKTYI